MGGRAWHPRVHLWLARARVELERRSQSGAVTNQRMMRSAVLASAALKRNAAPFANAGLLDFRFRPLVVPISQRAPLYGGALVMEFDWSARVCWSERQARSLQKTIKACGAFFENKRL